MPQCGSCLSNSGDDSPILVITGGTGVVGSALVQRLAVDLPRHKIVLLTRRPERIRATNVMAVFADLEKADLGLDDKVKSLLRSGETIFIHGAADTRFNLPIEQAKLTNTQGTRHVLELARMCSHLRQFAHISTLYVTGRREGLVGEGPLEHKAGYVNTYEASKHEAEDLVLAESEHMPVGIYRLSSVVDPYRNGGHVRQLIRFVTRSDQFRFFPADQQVPVDLIGSDWAARALSALITQHFTPGCIRHICAGEALPLGAIMDKVFRAWESSTSMAVRRPTLVSLSEFERLCKRLTPGGHVSRTLSSLMTFIPHLSIAQPFDCTISARLLERSGVPAPDMNSLLSGLLAEEFG
jgi:nucleoside-diphosphate-sugar epimerase